MLRKLVIVLVALTSTAVIASPASARGFGGHHGGGRGFHGGGHHFGGGHRGHRFGGFRHHHHHRFARYGYYGAGYGGAYYADSCYRIVDTEDGPRRVYVCD